MGTVANDQAVARPVVPAPAPPPSVSAAPATPSPRGLTVAEVLQTPVLAGAQVLAGSSGLHRVVARLNIMEVPDILPWVKPHELLLTTGYPLHQAPETLVELVAGLDARGLAAIAVKLGRYLDKLPPAMLEQADRLGLPVISLPHHVAFDDVFDQVLTQVLDRQAGALARAEEVHRALVAVVLEGGGLPAVADQLAGLLRAAVVVTTPDGRVLVESGDPEQLRRMRLSGCFDATGRLRTEHLRPTVQADASGSHVSAPVVAGALHHGRIAAFASGGGLDDMAVQVLERGAMVAALVITKELAVWAVESKYQGDFLRDLLDGRVEDLDAAVRHARSLGWDIDRPLVVIVAELDPRTGEESKEWPSRRPAQERFTTAWASVVHARDRAAAVVGFSSQVVALVGAPEGGDVERLVGELATAVSGDGGGGRRPWSAGVSRVARTPADLATAHEQARKAVQIGRLVHGGGGVAHFDKLGVFRVLSLVPDAAELRSFVTEVLGELATRDDAETADLRHTLEVLLETNLNVAETARRLHFHYNTLRYRIAKLERLLGPFTEDPHLRLDVLLALQVLKMRGI